MSIFHSRKIAKSWFTFNEIEVSLQAFLTLAYALALIGIVSLDILSGDIALLQSIINFLLSFAGIAVLVFLSIFLYASLETASLPFRRLDQEYLSRPQRALKLFIGLFTTTTLLFIALQTIFNSLEVYDSLFLFYSLFGYVIYLLAKSYFFMQATKKNYPFSLIDINVAPKIVILYVALLFGVNILVRMIYSSELLAFIVSLVFIQGIGMLHKRRAAHTF